MSRRFLHHATLLCALAVATGLPAAITVLAQDAPAASPRRSDSPAVSIGGGDVRVAPGEYLDELVLIGGSAEIEGLVRRDVVLVAARARITGEVRGSVISVMTNLEMGPDARIGRELISVLGQVDKPPTATIGREFINIPIVNLSRFASGNLFTFVLWLFLWIKLLKIAGLLLVVILFVAVFSERLDLASEALPQVWGRSLLIGLLLFVLVPTLCIILACTLIGIPLAVVIGFITKVVTWFGLAAVLCALGHGIARNVLDRTLSTFAATMLGFLVASLIYLVPVAGGLFLWLLGTLGLGLMIVTRLGARIPLPATAGAPPPPVPGPLPEPPPGGAAPPPDAPEGPEPPGSPGPTGRPDRIDRPETS